jgi:soluble lytic murein transglycosylase-like protein
MIKLFFITLMSFSAFAEDAMYKELVTSGFVVNTPMAKVESNNFNFDHSFSYHPQINKMRKQDLNKKMLNRVPARSQNKAERVVPAAIIVADHFRLDPFYIVSVIWVESDFTSTAISNKGASGFMQIMPETKKYLKNTINYSDYSALNLKMKKLNLNANERENLILGAYYLKQLKNKYKDPKLAAIAYNMGPGWVDDQRKNLAPVGLNNQYLNKIKARYWRLSGLNR